MYQRLSCLPAEKRKALTCGEMKWIQTLNLKEETDYAVSDSREAQRGTADCQCHRGQRREKTDTWREAALSFRGAWGIWWN